MAVAGTAVPQLEGKTREGTVGGLQAPITPRAARCAGGYSPTMLTEPSMACGMATPMCSQWTPGSAMLMCVQKKSIKKMQIFSPLAYANLVGILCASATASGKKNTVGSYVENKNNSSHLARLFQDKP